MGGEDPVGGRSTGSRRLRGGAATLRPHLFTVLGVVMVGAAVACVIAFARFPVEALSAAYPVMLVIAAVADARLFAPPERREALAVYPSVVLSFAALLAWGVGPALIVQVVALAVASVRMRFPWWRSLFELAEYTLAFSAAEVVLRLGGFPVFPLGGRIGFADVVTVVLATAAWLLVRFLTVTWAVAAHTGRPWWPLFVRMLMWRSLSYGALLLLSPALVAAASMSAALVPLVAVPMYAVYRMAWLATERVEMTRRDPLTGLGNRAALATEFAERTASGAGRRGGRIGLLILDLDRFKEVNEALGHTVGDRLLIEVGRRLRSVAGPGDRVFRLGGDEFALLVSEVTGAAEARGMAVAVAAALADPVRLDGLPVDVSGTIGVAVYPEHGRDVTALLRCAEVAMYDAKQRGAAAAVYHPQLDDYSPQRLALLADLRQALAGPDRDTVQLHYQPQVDVATGEVVGVEALLRWHHPTLGMVSPDHLIRIAEHTAVMRRLTLHVIDTVVDQLAEWEAAGIHLRASVNISVRDLQTGEVAERIAAQLRRHGLPAQRLQLEITEGALMADPRRMLATVAALDRLGVRISLDDFGTGFSSLQHLRRLPLSEIKIDRSFVLGMSTDSEDAAIVTSIVQLARALGLRVVAEGVEDETTWRMLAGIGCDVAQGWFYARPMPADVLPAWLARHRPLPAAGRAAGTT